MKVIITKKKVIDAIYRDFDKTFNTSEMSWVYGRDEGEDGYVDIDRENENFLIFYKGDWQGEDDSDVVFYYFDVDYFSDEASSKPFKDKSPILEVIGKYGESLDNLFGNFWKEPMKKWFQFNFELPVQSVSSIINYGD